MLNLSRPPAVLVPVTTPVLVLTMEYVTLPHHRTSLLTTIHVSVLVTITVWAVRTLMLVQVSNLVRMKATVQ